MRQGRQVVHRAIAGRVVGSVPVNMVRREPSERVWRSALERSKSTRVRVLTSLSHTSHIIEVSSSACNSVPWGVYAPLYGFMITLLQ